MAHQASSVSPPPLTQPTQSQGRGEGGGQVFQLEWEESSEADVLLKGPQASIFASTSLAQNASSLRSLATFPRARAVSTNYPIS